MESSRIMRPIRVGVIGAGAAAEGIHLPALARTGRRGDRRDRRSGGRSRSSTCKRKFGVPAGYRDLSRRDPAHRRGDPRHPAPVSRAGDHRPAERRRPRARREADGAVDRRVRRDDSGVRSAPARGWRSACSAASRRRFATRRTCSTRACSARSARSTSAKAWSSAGR